MRVVVGVHAVLVLGCGHPPGASSDALGDSMLLPEALCNGIDDDGNGIIDEGCPCIPFDVTADAQAVTGSGTGLAWLGDHYVVAGAVGAPIGIVPITSRVRHTYRWCDGDAC